MGTKYSSVSISGYNTSPPVDDGTISEANKVKWSGVKTKLADPVKTAIESINTAVAGSIGTVIARSSNTQIAASNYDDMFVCTSTFSQTFVGASTLGAGWRCYIVNNGTGTITLTPNGTETINGLSSIALSYGSSGMVYCDGSNLYFSGYGWSSQQSGRNAIINGSFNIWQRNTSFTSPATETYTADRWVWVNSSAGAVTISVDSSDVPTVAQAGVYVGQSYKVDVTTSDASIAAGDIALISQRIEGFNWRSFAQRALILSFWVKSSKTGTHCVSLRNSAPDRSYVGTYTVNATDTWEKKTVTFSASPSAGTWNYDTGIGAYLDFCLAAGSTYQTTAGAWQTGNFSATSAQVNLLDSASNFFRLALVQLEVGSIATDFEIRPYSQSLEMCQRYYEVGGLYGQCHSGYVTSGVASFCGVRYATSKRTASHTVTATIGAVSRFPATNPTVVESDVNGFYTSCTANDTGPGYYFFTWSSEDEL